MKNNKCYACSNELEDVFVCREDKPFDQYNNALWVEFDGGYGEFVDVMDEPNPYKACICHKCAHDLCDQIPWIKKLITPYNSHSHTEEYRKNNPDHYGWDYDWAKENNADL